MTVTSVNTDTEEMTLTLIADFDASADRVWELWADPRQLERWWGPPAAPATFKDHDLTPGGSVTYFMTGPDGEQHHGWWRVTSVDPPKSLEFTYGFADKDGNPIDEPPSNDARMTLTEHKGGTRMELRATFASPEHLEQMRNMGMVEGLSEAVGQMDALLAA